MGWSDVRQGALFISDPSDRPALGLSVWRNMRITASTSDFRDALSRVAPLASRRTNLDALRSVLLQATKGKVQLVATDFECLASVVVAAEADEDGKLLLPADKLSQILNAASCDQVSIDFDGMSIEVNTGFGKHRMSTVDASLFPGDTPNSNHVLTIPVHVLRAGLSRIISGAGETDSALFAFACVRLESSGGELSFVASNDRSMSIYQVAGEESEFAILIPGKSATFLARLLREETGDCRVSLAAGSAVFNCDRCNVATRLAEGRFPQWRNAVPISEPEINLFADSFESAIREAMIHTSEESRGVQLSIRDGFAEFSSGLAGSGESCEIRIPVDSDANESALLDPRSLMRFMKSRDSTQPLSLHFPVDKTKGIRMSSGASHFTVIAQMVRE